VNVNVADFDATKHSGLSLVGDARATLEALSEALSGYEVETGYREQVASTVEDWYREVERFYTSNEEPLPAQSQVIGAVNKISDSSDVVVCAAGASAWRLA
jgi:Acetolactate synthase